jgi:hypothetical protein
VGLIGEVRTALAAAARRRRTLGALAVNLAPVIGVLFWGWSASALMVLYWIENLVIGVANIARMGASGLAHGRVGVVSALAFIPFFALHYGIFCLVHGVFVFTFFGGGLGRLDVLSSLNGPFDLPRLLRAVHSARPGLGAGVWAIVVWQIVQFLVFYLGAGTFRRVDPVTQMMAPYRRIIILHVTIMAAGVVVIALGAPMIGLLVLALLKAGFDIFADGRAGEASGRKGWAAVQALAAHGFRPPSPPRE